MKSLPNLKVYIFTFGILLVYFSIDFFNSKKKSFVQLSFNWSKEKIIKEYKNALIDSIDYNYISLKIPNSIKLTPQNTFAIKVLDNKYYFRATTIENINNLYNFKRVIWLKNNKPKINEKGSLLEVNIPLIQKGVDTINTIGDAFLTYNWANYFRNELNKLSDIVFVGNNIDLFAYPHDGILLKSTSHIATNIKKTKHANKYILFMGNHDDKLSNKQILINWKNIITELNSRKNTKKIIVILLPPSKNEHVNKYRVNYNNLLISLNKTFNIRIINFYELLDKQFDLDYTGNYPNKGGYKILAKKIINDR